MGVIAAEHGGAGSFVVHQEAAGQWSGKLVILRRVIENQESGSQTAGDGIGGDGAGRFPADEETSRASFLCADNHFPGLHVAAGGDHQLAGHLGSDDEGLRDFQARALTFHENFPIAYSVFGEPLNPRDHTATTGNQGSIPDIQLPRASDANTDTVQNRKGGTRPGDGDFPTGGHCAAAKVAKYSKT